MHLARLRREHGDLDPVRRAFVLVPDGTADATLAIRASLSRRSTVADLLAWTKAPGLGDAAVRKSLPGDAQSGWHSEMLIFTLRNAEIGVYLIESPSLRTDEEWRTKVLQIAEVIERTLRGKL